MQQVVAAWLACRQAIGQAADSVSKIALYITTYTSLMCCSLIQSSKIGLLNSESVPECDTAFHVVVLLAPMLDAKEAYLQHTSNDKTPLSLHYYDSTGYNQE